MSSESNTAGPARIQDARNRTPGTVLLWRIGWGALIFFTVAFALNHLGGVFYIATSNDERQMFELFGILHLLALVILLIPYRRREWWAWLAMWLAIVPWRSSWCLPRASWARSTSHRRR